MSLVIAPLLFGGCALLTDLGGLAPSMADAGDASNDGGADATGDVVSLIDGQSPGMFACHPAPTGTLACEDWEGAPTMPCASLGAGAYKYGAATAQIDPTHSVSPTHSAAFASPIVTSGTSAYACSVSNASQPKGTLSLSLALRVNQVDTAVPTGVASVSYDGNTFQLMASNGNLVLDLQQPASDGGTTSVDYTLVAYTLGEWTAVRFDLATTPSVTATVWIVALKQGQLEPDPSSTAGWSQVFFKTLPLSPPTSSARNATVGLLPISNTSTATDFEIDNYLLRSF